MDLYILPMPGFNMTIMNPSHWMNRPFPPSSRACIWPFSASSSWRSAAKTFHFLAAKEKAVAPRIPERPPARRLLRLRNVHPCLQAGMQPTLHTTHPKTDDPVLLTIHQNQRMMVFQNKLRMYCCVFAGKLTRAALYSYVTKPRVAGLEVTLSTSTLMMDGFPEAYPRLIAGMICSGSVTLSP